jgi:hypothetical protein
MFVAPCFRPPGVFKAQYGRNYWTNHALIDEVSDLYQLVRVRLRCKAFKPDVFFPGLGFKFRSYDCYKYAPGFDHDQRAPLGFFPIRSSTRSTSFIFFEPRDVIVDRLVDPYPNCLMNGRLSAEAVPTTSAPFHLANCTAKRPIPPDAP